MAGEGKKRARLVVGMSGASGQILGIRLLEVLRAFPDVETHLVISPAARATIRQETSWSPQAVQALADVVYRPGDIAAPIASGSFRTLGMVIVPCSIKTLSAVAHSYASDLLTRAADVTLKEGRPLLLVVRETPLHLGHLRLMLRGCGDGRDHLPPHARVLRAPPHVGPGGRQPGRAHPGPSGLGERPVPGVAGGIFAPNGVAPELPCGLAPFFNLPYNWGRGGG